MEARPRIVLIYETEDGKAPFNEWLEKLRDRQVRAFIRTRINRLRLGLFGDCKTVGNGVSELRISFGAGYRLYFGQEGNEIIILLCGGDKSSQSKDIAKAKEYWQDYRRCSDG
jgi:putative addiction module killer protein